MTAWPRANTMIVSGATDADGVRCNVMWGKVATRPGCACTWRIGVKFGSNEPVFSPTPCEDLYHKRATEAALRRMQEMPPSDDELGELFEALFNGNLDLQAQTRG